MVMEFVFELFFTGCLSFCMAFLFVKFVSSVGATEACTQEQEKCCVSSTIPTTEYVHIEEDHNTSLDEDEDEVVEEKQRLVKHEIESETKVCECVQQQVEEKVENFTRCEENLVDEATSTLTPSLSHDADVEANDLIKLEVETGEDEQEEEEETGEHEKEEETGEFEQEDDDWEGIERSEVEKIFSCASQFVGSSDGKRLVSQLSNEVQKQLHGLHRVAIEGPCHGMPPMALMVAARAKWHAWQQLGNMTPEVAMEQYVNLLSDAIPGWAGENHKHDTEQDEGNPVTGESGTNTEDSLLIHPEPNLTSGRKSEERQSLGESCDDKSL